MASAGARAYTMRVWGRSPQRGPGAEPLVRGSGGEAPWSWKHFNTEEGKFGTLFEVKRLKPGTKYIRLWTRDECRQTHTFEMWLFV